MAAAACQTHAPVPSPCRSWRRGSPSHLTACQQWAGCGMFTIRSTQWGTGEQPSALWGMLAQHYRVELPRACCMQRRRRRLAHACCPRARSALWQLRAASHAFTHPLTGWSRWRSRRPRCSVRCLCRCSKGASGSTWLSRQAGPGWPLLLFQLHPASSPPPRVHGQGACPPDCTGRGGGMPPTASLYLRALPVPRSAAGAE